VEPVHRTGPPRAPDDDGATLLVAAGAGDAAAFAALYDLYAARVFGLVLWLVPDEPAAEEVTLSVFVELWRTAPLYGGSRRSASSWILTTTLRHAIAHLRAVAPARRAPRNVHQKAHDDPYGARKAGSS
jgi:RNA polymerase sigma-70 factor (ECF subfamily)